jgi:hypothetical protein
MAGLFMTLRRKLISVIATAALMAVSGPVLAQSAPVDAAKAIDADLSVTKAPAPATAPAPAPATPQPSIAPVAVANPPAQNATFHEADVIGASESVFGKGAKGLGDVIKNILAKQGEPNGYIVGHEGGAAMFAGLRYGSGTLYHKVEGQKPVYWAGPSLGLDAGVNAGDTFILVYNLFNTDDLYHRFGAGEGQAYFIGGFHVSYLRRGDVVLIPVRVGLGFRLGVNTGYMKFGRKSRVIPF